MVGRMCQQVVPNHRQPEQQVLRAASRVHSFPVGYGDPFTR
jgi:hypothetical protein